MGSFELPREYRVRPRSAVTTFGMLGLAGLGLLGQMAGARHMPVWLRGVLLVAFAAFVVILVYSVPRRFTRVDEKGITLRNVLRVRRFGWAELHDIRAEAVDEQVVRQFGMRALVYAYRSDGKRIQLPCLDDRELPHSVHFETSRIRALWAECRGPEWQRDPETEGRIARAAARRDRWLRASTGWVAPTVFVVVIIAVVVLCVALFD